MTSILSALAFVPYSLGDAIDWKQFISSIRDEFLFVPLLARGRDRLETIPRNTSITSWIDPLLARGRDRLETGKPDASPYTVL